MSVITEIHGWVNIRYTYENSEKADALSEQHLPSILEKIYEKISHLNFTSAEVRVIENYGEHFLTVCGFSWHTSDSLDCISLYEFIAQMAKGSYGLLYSINYDESVAKVFVMKKGKLYIHEDKFLSPLIPETEDYFSE